LRSYHTTLKMPLGYQSKNKMLDAKNLRATPRTSRTSTSHESSVESPDLKNLSIFVFFSHQTSDSPFRGHFLKNSIRCSAINSSCWVSVRQSAAAFSWMADLKRSTYPILNSSMSYFGSCLRALSTSEACLSFRVGSLLERSC